MVAHPIFVETILARTGLFGRISRENRLQLATACAGRSLRKNGILFREGEAGSSIYILASGSVRLHKTDSAGRDVTIKIVRPGEMFAEIVLFESEVYPVTATALKASSLYRLQREDLMKLLRQDDFLRDFFANLMGKLRFLSNQIRDLTSPDLEARLFGFLRSQFGEAREITPPFSKKDLAAAIGVAPETLSRLLLKLRKDRRLVWDQGKISIFP